VRQGFLAHADPRFHQVAQLEQPDPNASSAATHADQALDVEVVRRKFAALASEISQATGEQRTPEAVAEA